MSDRGRRTGDSSSQADIASSGFAVADGGADPSTKLGVRRMPVRARGQAAFERILDTTAVLLEEIGLEAVTTNLIAERSGTNIATVYKYFPNKHAIIAELFKRVQDERTAAASTGLQGLRHSQDWRAQVSAVIAEVCRLRKHRKGSLALRHAMRAAPELQQLDRQQTENMAAIVAAEIAAASGTSRAQCAIVATCMVEAANALIDLWSEASPADADRIRTQIDALLLAYLAPYFENAKPRARR